MSHRRDRLAVLKALAEFDRACRAFSQGMARISQPQDPALQEIIKALGPPRPAKRAGTEAIREFLRSSYS